MSMFTDIQARFSLINWKVAWRQALALAAVRGQTSVGLFLHLYAQSSLKVNEIPRDSIHKFVFLNKLLKK